MALKAFTTLNLARGLKWDTEFAVGDVHPLVHTPTPELREIQAIYHPKILAVLPLLGRQNAALLLLVYDLLMRGNPEQALQADSLTSATLSTQPVLLTLRNGYQNYYLKEQNNGVTQADGGYRNLFRLRNILANLSVYVRDLHYATADTVLVGLEGYNRTPGTTPLSILVAGMKKMFEAAEAAHVPFVITTIGALKPLDSLPTSTLTTQIASTSNNKHNKISASKGVSFLMTQMKTAGSAYLMPAVTTEPNQTAWNAWFDKLTQLPTYYDISEATIIFTIMGPLPETHVLAEGWNDIVDELQAHGTPLQLKHMCKHLRERLFTAGQTRMEAYREFSVLCEEKFESLGDCKNIAQRLTQLFTKMYPTQTESNEYELPPISMYRAVLTYHKVLVELHESPGRQRKTALGLAWTRYKFESTQLFHEYLQQKYHCVDNPMSKQRCHYYIDAVTDVLLAAHKMHSALHQDDLAIAAAAPRLNYMNTANHQLMQIQSKPVGRPSHAKRPLRGAGANKRTRDHQSASTPSGTPRSKKHRPDVRATQQRASSGAGPSAPSKISGKSLADREWNAPSGAGFEDLAAVTMPAMPANQRKTRKEYIQLAVQEQCFFCGQTTHRSLKSCREISKRPMLTPTQRQTLDTVRQARQAWRNSLLGHATVQSACQADGRPYRPWHN